MDPLGILFAFITIMAWGTWLAPSQKIVLPNAQARTLYISIGNLFLASIALLVVGPSRLSWEIFLYPFLGGLIWAISGLCAFTATQRIGIARAFGTWAPLNILVAIAWGMILFGEFLKTGPRNQWQAIASVFFIIIGILFIIFSAGTGKGERGKQDLLIGFGGAIGAGILWGTYFVPIAFLTRKVEGVTDWLAAFPLAVGMTTGSAILVWLSKKKPRCQTKSDYSKVLLSGLLWSIGNFSMLLMVTRIGIGKGFALAQLCVIVNALIGIFLFKEPAIHSRAAKWVLLGITLAAAGSIGLGNLKDGM